MPEMEELKAWLLFHAGPEEELQPLLEALKAEGVFVRELSTCGVAYHSPLLDPLLPQLTAGERPAIEGGALLALSVGCWTL